MRKWLIAITYLITIVFVIFNQETIIAWLQKGGDVADIPYVLLLATFLALVPVIPFGVIGGIAGVKYGLWLGGLINVASSTLAAVIMFAAVRYVFSARGRQYLMRQKSLHQFTLLVEKNAFLSVLIGRLIPVLPSAAINIYAALSKIPFMSFLSATVLGKIPVMLVFAFVGDNAFEDIASSIYALGIYAGFLLIVYVGYRIRLSSQRQ